jgi:23S rRNA (adenine2503-C2)-methyltransferase
MFDKMNTTKYWIFDKSQKELEEYCACNGFKKYGAEQVMRWIYSRRLFDFSKMTDIPNALRENLADNFNAALPEVTDMQYETDDGGSSKKYLIKFIDGGTIESVLINYKDRKTLCLSSQIGCRMGCVYCETSRLGFTRNLTSGEIISQILTVENDTGAGITNIVFMGMGEPLDNIEEVEKSLDIISNDKFIGIAPRKITVSTCGMLNVLSGLNLNEYRYKIAVSLNASDNDTRSMLMPINKKFPIEDLAGLINGKKPSAHNKTTIEYVLIKGVNDDVKNAKKLIGMFSPAKVKFNLIPLNKEQNSAYLKNFERPENTAVDDFKLKLSKAGFTVTVRFSKALSINGGCGQLKAKTIDSR